jgi:hypothetical protein
MSFQGKNYGRASFRRQPRLVSSRRCRRRLARRSRTDVVGRKATAIGHWLFVSTNLRRPNIRRNGSQSCLLIGRHEVSAVQNIQIEGRHSDQSCRRTAEHGPACRLHIETQNGAERTRPSIEAAQTKEAPTTKVGASLFARGSDNTPRDTE